MRGVVVADPAIIWPDMELFLTSWFRTHLPLRPEPVCASVSVVRVEPSREPFPERTLVIRDDGISRTGFLTGDASVGLTVLAGTRENPADAKLLARIVLAMCAQIPSPDPDNPVAVFSDSNGPFLVPEAQPRARAYSNVVFGVVGSAL